MNMVRAVLIAGLLALVVSVLAIPAMVPAPRFLQLVKADHQVNRHFITQQAAARVLERMLDLHDAAAAQARAPAPAPRSVPAGARAASGLAIDAAVAARLGQAGEQLLRNDYVRSLDGLLLLVIYRLSLGMEFMPVILVFMVIVFVDGSVLRMVRTRQFVAHSPETAGISAAAGVAFGCAGALMLVMPLQMHPMAFLASALLSLYAFSRFIANYHVIR